MVDIRKMNKLDNWEPHNLSNSQKIQRIQVYISLMSPHTNEPLH